MSRTTIELDIPRTAAERVARANKSMDEHDRIWNAAIETAAKLVEDYGPYNKDKAAKIRDLKR